MTPLDALLAYLRVCNDLAFGWAPPRGPAEVIDLAEYRKRRWRRAA